MVDREPSVRLDPAAGLIPTPRSKPTFATLTRPTRSPTRSSSRTCEIDWRVSFMRRAMLARSISPSLRGFCGPTRSCAWRTRSSTKRWRTSSQRSWSPTSGSDTTNRCSATFTRATRTHGSTADGRRATRRSTRPPRPPFKAGYGWTASFDLTAFYDSIDHGVLDYLLEGINVDRGLREFLAVCLGKWTATSTQIYHRHGIPQGPLSSGLIAEAVLRHFDEKHDGRVDVFYFRYVDDIRLFARSELPLRQALVALDRLSKDVGLFPQSGKNLHPQGHEHRGGAQIGKQPDRAGADRAYPQPGQASQEDRSAHARIRRLCGRQPDEVQISPLPRGAFVATSR